MNFVVYKIIMLFASNAIAISEEIEIGEISSYRLINCVHPRNNLFGEAIHLFLVLRAMD